MSGDRRGDILEAALGLFSARSFHEVSIHELFAAAEVSPSTFYRFFPNKQALFNELCRSLLRRVNGYLVEAGSIEEPDPRKRFTAIWWALPRLGREVPMSLGFLMRVDPKLLDEENRRGFFPPAGLVEVLAPLQAALVWGTFTALLRLAEIHDQPISMEDFKASERLCWAALSAA